MFLPSPSLSLFRFLEKGFVSSETGHPPFSTEWSFVTLNLTRTDPSPMRKALCSKTARDFRAAATRNLSRTVRDAILGHAPNPIDARQGIRVMGLLELGVRSHAEGRTLPVLEADLAP